MSSLLDDIDDLSRRIAIVRDRIIEQQTGYSNRFVLFSQDLTGLGGQISRRILAIRVAIMTRRTAVFPNENFYPYENAFQPLAEMPPNAGEAPVLDLARFEEDSEAIVSFDFWEFWQKAQLTAKVYGYVPEELADLPNAALLFDGIAFATFQLMPNYRNAIAPDLEKIQRLRPLIGVHFRRGDKYVETPYVEANAYRTAIDEAAQRHGIHTVFIASDSPNAVRELKLNDAAYTVCFDAEELRYNNANHKFLMKNRDLARQETMTAIRNIYMLASCTRVVGQANAHFACLAAGKIMFEGPTLDFGMLLEPRLHPVRWIDRVAYSAYRCARKITKKLLPVYTLKNIRR